MKALVCEMCNSSDMVKQDGFFVCQHCGMKYSVEEAKKMMIEGTVDVTGTVKVDNSAFVEKYLINARRAKDKTDWEEVEKYYNMVEQNDPTNIEAIFYSAYGKAMMSLPDSDKFKRKQKFEVFEKSISVIDDNYDVSKSAELEKVIIGMSGDLITMAGSSFVYNQTTKNNITSDDRGETYVMFARAEIAFIESVENIIAKDEKAYLYKLLVVHYRRCILSGYITDASKKKYQEKMQNVIDKLSQLEPSYQAPEIPKIKVKIGNSIALTIAYAAFTFAIFKWFMPIMRRADMEYLGWIFVAFGALGCLANVFSIIKKLKNK